MPRSLTDIRSEARKHTKRAIEVLGGILACENSTDDARIKAAAVLLDRGWGKPQVHIEIDETIHHVITDETMDVGDWSETYRDRVAAPTRPPKSTH